MRTYEYRGYDQAGRPARGLVEALAVKEARKLLADRGILAEKIAPSGRKVRFPRSVRSLFYHELSSLLGAGMPLAQALDVLIRSPELGDTAILLAGVKDRVIEGRSLADALADAAPEVGPFEKAIIEAAEESADVERMLDRLGGFLDTEERFVERLRSALIYPSIIVALGIVVAILMLGVLLPKTAILMERGSIEPPWITSFMMGLGSWLVRWGVLAVLVLAGGIVLVRRRLRQNREFAIAWDQWIYRVPFAGHAYRVLASLRFSRTLAMLVGGGVSLLNGVTLAGRATGSPWVETLSATESENMRHGASLSKALSAIPPLAESLAGLVHVGESSGSLSTLLDKAADRFQGQWDRLLDRTLRIIEPLLILLIGGFVLMVVLSVLLPIMSYSRILGM